MATATAAVAAQPGDPGSSGSGSLGGQYEKLLATVGSLQGDLQRTVGVCQSLGSQNDKLKSNYEAVRTELIHLREKHNTTRKQLLEAVESRVDADQRTETLVHKWKVQLEGRTRELEALQAKLVPQDLDMLRAKVQEELQVPHQRRVGSLEAEVERHRQMFCKARRDHERCKAEYEQYTIDQGREMEALHQQHKAESHVLKMRVQDLEASFADADRDEEGRLLRRKLEEAEAVKAQLHAEMAAVRSEREAAELERHKLVLAHQSESAATHVRVSTLEADKKALQRRCAEAEDTTDRRRRQADDARDRLQDALEEVSKLKEACAGKDRVALEARAEVRHAAERLALEWGREKAELKAANEGLIKRIALAERRSREASEQAANRFRAAQQVEERVRSETGKETSALRESLSQLEAEVERLRLEGERVGSSAQQDIQKMRGESERAKSEASRVLREKEALRERVAALQSAADRSEEAAEGAGRERDEARAAAAAAAQRAQRERECLAEVEGENEGLRERLRMAEEELAGLVAEADQAREAHVSALKDIRRAAGAERDSHVARVRYELESLRRRAHRSVRKERKRSRAYKAQAIEAHQRGQRTRQVLQSRASALALAAAGGGGGRAPAAPLTGGGLGEPAGGRGRERMIGRTPMDCTSSTFGAVGTVLLDPGGFGEGSGRDWWGRGRCWWRALAMVQAAS
ncbi:conserved unknown protein [Ectocarpus siliculosus]|uniref:Uncharacterized protein n=1 Tax=Ectocarpus siliculosus TaxID=2880 RepID=D7FPE6_ECTSI|nr:conserved unknown protein [Ectocarpus siliculosus]|eukprot:CBJ30404.1 conserved unknown protein [Ectocarpus siliculosus]